MKTVMKSLLLTSAIAMILFGMFSCAAPGGVSSPSGEEIGSLTISINDSVSTGDAPAIDGPNLDILPGVSMDPASYNIVGSGPNGASFDQTTTESTLVVDALAFGDWTLTVTALNDEETPIGVGTSTTTVHSNTTGITNVIVRPFSGLGTLNLSLDWTEGDVDTPQVDSTLQPSVGAARTLAFTTAGASASFSASDVPAGYHTLIIKLLDNGILTMGAVDVVRIAADQSSTGSFLFDRVNMATGTISIGITPEMGDPLTVEISGAEAIKHQNKSMTLTASTTNYTGNVNYVWYINGESVDTGESFVFDDTRAQGYYNIGVTAFNVDGSRAGSQSTFVEIDKPIYPLNLSTSYTFSETGNGSTGMIGGNLTTLNDENFTAKVNGIVVNEAQIGDTVTLTATIPTDNRQVSLTGTGNGTTIFSEKVLNSDGETYSFTMPGYAVEIEGLFSDYPEAITVNVTGATATINDQLISDLSEAVAGEIVTLTINLGTDHEMELSTSDGTLITSVVRDDNSTVTFIMPGNPITITGQVEARAYQITRGGETSWTNGNWSVTWSIDKSWARPGETVTLGAYESGVDYSGGRIGAGITVSGSPAGVLNVGGGTADNFENLHPSFTMPSEDVHLIGIISHS